MKRRGKLFAVMFLSLAMIFTLAPLNVMAEDGNKADETQVEESAVIAEPEVKEETPAEKLSATAENVEKVEKAASGPIEVETDVSEWGDKETDVTGNTGNEKEEAAEAEKPKTEEPAGPKDGDTKPVAVKAVWHPVDKDGNEITTVTDEHGVIHHINPVVADSGWVSEVILPEHMGDNQKEYAKYEDGKWNILCFVDVSVKPFMAAYHFGVHPQRIIFTDDYGEAMLQGKPWAVHDVKYGGVSLSDGDPNINFGMLILEYKEGAVMDIYTEVNYETLAEATYKEPVLDVPYDGDDDAVRKAIYDNIDELGYYKWTPNPKYPDTTPILEIIDINDPECKEYKDDMGKNFEGIYLIDKATGEYVSDDNGEPRNFKENSFENLPPGEYEIILANYFRSLKPHITHGYDLARLRYKYTQAVHFPMNFTVAEPVNYTITYVLDGGTLDGQEGPVSFVYEENTQIELPLPVKEGYRFLYWEGSQYNAGDMYTVTEDHTFTAKWERIKYRVTFDSKGGTAVDPQTVNWGEKAIKPVDPLLEGHSFEGWYKDIDYSSLYNFDTHVKSDITLFGKWKVNTYVVNFDSDGGTAVAPQVVNFAEKAIEPENLTKEGYTFRGWYEEKSNKPYDFNTPVKSNVNLKAHWEINKYTVTFDSDGGTAVEPQTVSWGEKATEPENPTKEGYTFKGWFEENSKDPYDFETEVKSDINLKAHWEINKYTVTFDSDGGTAVEPQTVNWGEKATEPENPTKEGYTFKGWFEENADKAFDFNTEIKNDVNLKAHWEINKYTVTFDSDGGTAVEPQTVNWGEKATEPENPTKEGYTFKGWFEENADKAFDFNTEIKSDVNLKAKWQKIKDKPGENIDKPETPQTPSGNTKDNTKKPEKGVQTGDGSEMGIYALLILASAATVLAITKRRKLDK